MKRIAAIACIVAALSGCVTMTPTALRVTEAQLSKRQLETRKYQGIKEGEILAASAAVLQDLGYNLDNSESALGVLTASKQRDATDSGEVALAVVVALLGGGAMAMSKEQTIRVSLVVRPLQEETKDQVTSKDVFFVRVVFQRVVLRTDGSRYAQTLEDPEIYQGFFEKLSKAIFIEGQQI